MSTPGIEPQPRRVPSKEADAAIGARAHMLMWREGRTQGDVAAALGVDSTGLGKKLKGRNRWAIQEVIDLAAELRTTVAYLVGETDDPGVPGLKLLPTDYEVVVSEGEGASVFDLFTGEKLSA